MAAATCIIKFFQAVTPFWKILHLIRLKASHKGEGIQTGPTMLWKNR